MKIIAGTNKRKKEAEGKKESAAETSEETKKGIAMKIPKAVTDDPAKHRYQRTVRPIANGHITEHSYTNPSNGEYIRHEFYSQEDPMS